MVFFAFTPKYDLIISVFVKRNEMTVKKISEIVTNPFCVFHCCSVCLCKKTDIIKKKEEEKATKKEKKRGKVRRIFPRGSSESRRRGSLGSLGLTNSTLFSSSPSSHLLLLFFSAFINNPFSFFPYLKFSSRFRAMGVCFSAIRVTGASSSRPSSQTNNPKSKAAPSPIDTKRRTGSIPCGKRTDFGYAKDFHDHYTIGKLLGHGQFGYTYVAIHKPNGDRVAVKRLDKTKVLFSALY